MPSLNSILVGLTTFLTVAVAAPTTAAKFGVDCLPSKPQTTPTVPSSGNPTDLPSTTLTLQYVALGRGIQNYSCSAPSAVPTAIGAVATLFDATALAYTSLSTLHSLPPMVVYAPLPPANSPFYTASPSPFKVLGHHYFDAKGTPTFSLDSVSKILYAAKVGDVKPPTTSNKGPAGTGAVDWLALTAKAGYTSVGLGEVYRVVTAGGSPPTSCTAAGVVSIQYAAEYWFYD